MTSAVPTFDQPVLISPAPCWLNVLPSTMAAGFLSPAEDHAVQRLDLSARDQTPPGHLLAEGAR